MKGVRPEGGKTSDSRVKDHKKYGDEHTRIFGKKERKQYIPPPLPNLEKKSK